MTTSALFMGLLGLAASFLPQEILAAAGMPEESLPELAVILVQALGALYLGFAILNWMAKGILVGGIYARPLALGNFLHFSVVTVVLVKAIFGDGPSPTLLALALRTLVPNIVSTVSTGNSCAKVWTRTWNASDGCGNTSGDVSQTITVRDVTAPTIGGQGSNSSVSGCPNTFGTPTFTAPTASDACQGTLTPNIVSTVSTGNSCAKVWTRTWNASDGCGNTSGDVSLSFSV
jgi:hypothetical protein